MMRQSGFTDADILYVLNAYDIANVKQCGGFAKECFPNALGQTYLHYCEKYSREKCLQMMEQVVNLGWAVLYAEPPLIEGAHEVLGKLSLSYWLFLITKGDKDLQEAKIKKSGLKKYFDKIYVVPEKNDAVFHRLVQKHGITACMSWSVGNSIKADINPALRAGVNCIHVETPSWDFEHEEPAGKYYTVRDLKDVVAIIQKAV